MCSAIPLIVRGQSNRSLQSLPRFLISAGTEFQIGFIVAFRFFLLFMFGNCCFRSGSCLDCTIFLLDNFQCFLLNHRDQFAHALRNILKHILRMDFFQNFAIPVNQPHGTMCDFRAFSRRKFQSDQAGRRSQRKMFPGNFPLPVDLFQMIPFQNNNPFGFSHGLFQSRGKLVDFPLIALRHP